MRSDGKEFIVIKKLGFFATTTSSNINSIRDEAIKNDFKLQYLNSILNKKKEIEALRNKNWQLHFKKIAYLLLVIPAKKIISRKRRRAKRLFKSNVDSSRHSFFKSAMIKQIHKIQIESSDQRPSVSEIVEKAPLMLGLDYNK